jgi:hypothetical protein
MPEEAPYRPEDVPITADIRPLLTVIDEATGMTGQGYTLARVYKIGNDKVRVHVERDHYRAQSYARAEVLTAERRWNLLADDSPHRWHATTPYGEGRLNIRAALGPICDRLARRAATILA